MNFFQKLVLCGVALAGALGIQVMDAQAKSAAPAGVHGLCATCDPIGDIIASRLRQEARPTPSSTPSSSAGREARQAAEAARKTVRDVRFVLAFADM
jgi:hypothetical protein